MKKNILIAIFVLGLVYILIPDPGTINDYPPLPNSLKSDEPGDTYQIQNIAAYFSNFDRSFITYFYRQSYRDKFLFGFLLPPISVNHPPKYALSTIRDQLFYVTFLEEYIYPLRGSILVAGYEPAVENDMVGADSNFYSDRIHINGNYYVSKTTLKSFHTTWYSRLFVYLGIWFSVFAIYKIFKKVKYG